MSAVVISKPFIGTGKTGEIVTTDTTDTTNDFDASIKNFNFTLLREGYDALGFFSWDNDADQLKSALNYKILEDYSAIIEPNVPTELSVSDDCIDCYFIFKLCLVSSVQVPCRNGKYNPVNINERKSVTWECSPYDVFQTTVTKLSTTDGSVLAVSTGYTLCMYVRRNMESLTSADLTATMNAMHTLWVTNEDQGSSTHGENYHSSAWFAEAHLFNAAQRDSDHIHEGLGFLPQHLKLSNLFELSMQSVDPSVSLPYWDFTAESGVLTNSYIFTADTFGSVRQPHDGVTWTYANDTLMMGAIPDGRWVNITAEKNTRFSDLKNGYGYLRGPWNTNPSPYISRFAISHTSLPTCLAYYEWLKTSDRLDFLDVAPFAPHASVHGGVGGIFGCDVFDSLLTQGLLKDEASKKAVCKKWTILLKEMYRSNHISASSDCMVNNLSVDGFTCGFTCSSTGETEMANSLKALIGDFAPDDLTTDDWGLWRDFVCDGDAHKVFSGDQLEAGSPSDPSFWPIHPNLERLFHLKLMSGGFETGSEWPSDASEVCDKSKCYEESEGSKDYWPTCCAGHFEYDQLRDFVTGSVSSGYGETNYYMMTRSDPTSELYAMPYVYDDFSWKHCKDDDYDFSELTLALLNGNTVDSKFDSTKAGNQIILKD